MKVRKMVRTEKLKRVGIKLFIIVFVLYFSVQYFSTKNKTSTVLYYCLYISPEDSTYDISLRNLKFFFKYGVFGENGIDYVFLIPEGSIIDDIKFPNHTNIELRRIGNYRSDIANFYSQLLREDDTHEYFIFMNVGVRGPFITSKNSRWHHELLRRMESNSMLGVSFSCFPQPHMQSHFLMMNKYGVHEAKKIWGKCFNFKTDDYESYHKFAMEECEKKLGSEKSQNRIRKCFNKTVDDSKTYHRFVVEQCEIGLSSEFIRKGHRFTSIERKYRNVDLAKIVRTERLTEIPCPHKNPIIKKQIDPFDVMFVKYGGEVHRQHLINKKTVRNIKKDQKLMKRNWNEISSQHNSSLSKFGFIFE